MLMNPLDDSPNDLAARAALRASAAAASARAAQAFSTLLALADDAPVDALAEWLAAGGDAGAPDAVVGAFVAGLAERSAAGEIAGGLTARLEDLSRDGVAMCFFGNALVMPAPQPEVIIDH
jgi:hypothetical protein